MEIVAYTGEKFTVEWYFDSESECDGIYAFKPKPHRFLCFFVKGKKLIITNGFIKKSDKLPKNEKEKALKRREDYETRCKKNQYYEYHLQ